MRAATVWTVFLGLSLWSGAASAQYEYELVLLSPYMDGGLGESYALDVNDAGLAVGFGSRNTYHAFSWSDEGGFLDLGLGLATGVNNDGLIVGQNAIWSGTQIVGVVPPPSTYFHTVHAADIGDNGMVVGLALHRIYSSSSDQTAIVWDPINGTRDLRGLGVRAAYSASAINTAREIVGTTSETGIFGNTRAFYFSLDTGEVIDLGTFFPGDLGNAAAADINETGVVVGEATMPDNDGDPHAFRWTKSGGLEDLGSLGAYQMNTWITLDQSSAYGINDAGLIVGLSTVDYPASSWDARHAFVWDPERGMRDLNDLVPLPAGVYLINATKISNTGWITGTTFGAANGAGYSAYILRPVTGGQPAAVGDIDHDGAVDITDLLTLLASWGECIGCPADLDNNGRVSVLDLLLLLRSWG